MKKIFIFAMFVILLVSLVSAIAAPLTPICKIEGTIQSIEFKAAYNDTCVSTDTCSTDTISRHRDEYFLNILIKEVSNASVDETDYTTCGEKYIPGESKIFTILKTYVQTEFKVNQTIEFESNVFLNSFHSYKIIDTDDQTGTHLVGGCAGVAPGNQNQCCINLGYLRWDIEDEKCTNETETHLVGGCAGVAPGYQNECCVNKGYSGWDEEEWKCIEENDEDEEDSVVLCTMDAKICPDGTSIGRTGPNCEFICPKQYNISREKVCCKVYGYGAEMNETNVRYKITDKRECIIPENFVGGNREIVNNSYCIQQIQETRQEFLEKKWEIMQERNRIKPHYLNQSECPDNCSCSGSTIKCEFENGTRVMTVYAGKSGNVIVQVKNINSSTNVTLYKSEGKVYGVFKDNETHEIILPDEVRDRIKEMEKNKEGRAINWTDENITLNETGFYHIEARKHARLFWIFPVKEKVKFEINSETGEITKTKTKWWGFLARDVREHSTSQ
ncbi:MAG: hypothetical protein NTZ83_00885 [Candidatus Pacearchaeota archaeon]|nr:hypothetical protein [Candidatus Pacearchaeota archaeon]